MDPTASTHIPFASRNRRRPKRRRPVSHFAEPLESRLLFAWIGALSGTSNDASHQYDNPANWAGGVIDDSFSGVTFTADTTLYLAGNRTTGASGLNLDYLGGFNLTIKSNSATTRTLTLAGDISGNFAGSVVTLGDAANPLNIALGTSTRTVTLAAAKTLVIRNVISGTGGLTKAGAGTLTLSGVNTYSGTTTLSAGQINLNSARAIGTGSFTLSGGSFDNTSGAAITLTSNNTQSWGADFTFVGSNALNLGTGAVTLTGNRVVTTTASTLTVGGVVSGAFSLAKAGAGTLTLAGANTYSGGFTLSDGQFNLNHARAPGTGTTTISGGTLDNTSGASITLTNNNAQTWASSFTFIGSNALNLGTGAVALTANCTLTVSASTFTAGGVVSGAFSLTKAGGGTLTLSGANTYSGGFTLSAGQFNLNNARAPGTGTITLNGGTLDNTSGAAITLTNNNAQSWAANFTFVGSNALNLGTGAVTLTADRTLTVSASTLTVGGVVSGAFLLTKAGTGTLSLSGANTYSGGTTLNAGTLTFLNGSLGSAGAITFAASSTLQWGGTNTQDISSRLAEIPTGVNATIDTVANTVVFATAITGAGRLVKSGTGALTLSGNNTHSGGTTLSAGTLNINSATALGTGTFTISGGTINNTSGAAVTLTTNNAQSWAGNFAFTGTNNLNLGTGAVTLTANRTVTANANTLVVGGAVSGAFLLTKAGNGALTLAGDNTYSGGTTISAGTVNINSATAIGTGTLTLSGGSINNTSGSDITLSNNNAVSVAANFTFTGTANLNLGTGSVTLTGNRSVTVNANTLNLGGNVSGAFTLTKAGNGALTLTGNNTHSGGTTLSAGTLNINSATAIGTGTLTLSGGTIDNTSGSAVTLSTNNAQSWAGNFAFTGTDDLHLGTGTVNLTANRTVATTAGTLTVGGVISGARSLTKAGNGALTLSGNNTYSLGTTLSAGTLNLDSPTAIGTGTLTLSGGTLGNTSGSPVTLTSNNAQSWAGNFAFDGPNDLHLGTGGVTLTANRTVTTTAGTLTVGGVISGARSLTKAGNGALTLSGNNTYSLGTVLTAGTLNLNSPTAIGTGTLTLSGGTLGNTSGNPVTLTSNNAQSWSGDFTFAGPSALDLGTGAVTLTADRTLTASDSSLTVGGAISGAFSLTKSGSGTLTLSGNNTFSGGTTLSAGVLNINSATAVGTGLLTLSAGTIDNTSGGPITLSNNNAQSWGGDFVFAGTGSLDLGTGAVALTADVVISSAAGTLAVGGVISGAFSIGKAGNGALTLSGNSTYSGGTTLSSGTLNMSSAAAIGTGTLTLSGGTLDNTSGSTIALANNNAQIWASSFVFAGTSDLNLGTGAVTLAADVSITTSSGSLVVGGVVSGAFGLTKLGNGTLELAGASTFSGGVTVGAGVLIASNAVPSTSATGSGPVSVASGATLAGSGSAAGPVTISSGGRLSPGLGSTAVFNVGSLVLDPGANLDITLDGDTAGSGYDQVVVAGTVAVNGAILNLSGSRSAQNSAGLAIILNDSADAITGTFAGLAEGEATPFSGVSYVASYAGTSGNDLVLTAQPAVTSTALTASASSSVFGQGINLTATITSGTAGTRTGTVTFLNGATSIGTASVDASGVATLTISTLSAGTPSITAVYGGDLNFAPSISPALVQTVNQATTTTSVSSSDPTVVAGQSITLTATTTVEAPGSGVPTGSVSFFDGTTLLGSATLDTSGTGVFSTSSLAVGSRSITAVFSGEANFTASSSAALTQTVSAAATTTSVSSPIASSVFGQSITLTATTTVEAPGSGVPTGTVSFFDGAALLGTGTLDSSGTATLSTTTLSVGSLSITAVFAGSTEFTASTSSAVTQAVTAASTTTTVSSSVDTPVFGQTVTFSATVAVSSPGSGMPTGTVTFFDGATPIGTSTIGGLGLATFSTASLSVGSHTITAVFAGDTRFIASISSVLDQTVAAAGTTTSVISSDNTPVFGQAITLTATVIASSPGSGVPTGTVSFFDGATALGTGTLNNSGIATLSTAALSVGSHSITAVFAGTSDYETSTSSVLTQAVSAAATTTSVVSSAASPVFGQSVTFTATVAPQAPGAGSPTGMVTFFDGAVSLGTATLDSAGMASLTVTSLAAGDRAITAVFAGDTSFTHSTSSALAQSVLAAATTTSVSSSIDSPVFGQSITLTATVVVSSPGAGVPTGTVTFFDGVTPIGTVSLDSSSIATISFAGLAVGSHSITATYNAETDFLGSSSLPLTQAVSPASTSVSLSTSLPSPVFGQSIALTASVQALAPGSGVPSGHVSFFDSGVLLGTVSLDSVGIATLITSSLSAGSHGLTAVYHASTNFTASTSAELTRSVSPAATSTSLTSSAPAIVFGQSITFTATVLTVAPGSGVAAGTVTFFDGTTVLGTAVLDASGVGTFTTAVLSSGSHSITAVFAGNASFTSSTSTATTATVARAGSTATLTPATTRAVISTPITFAVSIGGTPSAATLPTGIVTLNGGSMVLATATLDASGNATFTLSNLPAGEPSLTVVYAGDDNFISTTSTPVTIVINRASTTTTLTASTTSPSSGQPVLLTAALASPTATAGAPSGTVSFINGSTTLGTAVLDSTGTATLSLSALPAGTYAITAAYTGNATFDPSNSAPLSVTFSPAPTPSTNTPPTLILLSPPPLSTTSTSTAALSAIATDDGGEAHLNYRWDITLSPNTNPVRFSDNAANSAKSTVATFSQAGTYTVTLTVTDADGLSTQASTTITVVQTLTTLLITPDVRGLRQFQSFRFSSIALDQFGNTLANQPNTTWSILSGPGSVASDGTFIASSAAGLVTFRAAIGVNTASAQFTVAPVILAPVFVADAATSIVAGLTESTPTATRAESDDSTAATESLRTSEQIPPDAFIPASVGWTFDSALVKVTPPIAQPAAAPIADLPAPIYLNAILSELQSTSSQSPELPPAEQPASEPASEQNPPQEATPQPRRAPAPTTRTSLATPESDALSTEAVSANTEEVIYLTRGDDSFPQTDIAPTASEPQPLPTTEASHRRAPAEPVQRDLNTPPALPKNSVARYAATLIATMGSLLLVTKRSSTRPLVAHKGRSVTRPTNQFP